jgi:DnaK suppressor protein
MNITNVEARLRETLAQLEERLAHVTKDMSCSHSADSGEQAVERENDEVLEGIGQEAQTSIQHVRAALGRIDAGTYGVCAGCSAAINPARLEAVPESVRCVACAAD